MTIRALAVAGITSLPLLMAASAANAIPVTGSAGGSFSNLSSCDSSGNDRDCRIVNTSNGSSTEVQWGSQSIFRDFVNPSRLTSVDLNISTNTASGLGVAIGRLDWYNSATIAVSDLNSFAVQWALSLGFTAPSGPDASGGELFNLSISNPINPAGDLLYGLGLADLSSLGASVNLAGVSLSNLRYYVTDGAGAGSSSFGNNVWYNSENNWSSLYILADFRDHASSVPEPATLGLFGLGLLGMAFAARSRREVRP